MFGRQESQFRGVRVAEQVVIMTSVNCSLSPLVADCSRSGWRQWEMVVAMDSAVQERLETTCMFGAGSV